MCWLLCEIGALLALLIRALSGGRIWSLFEVSMTLWYFWQSRSKSLYLMTRAPLGDRSFSFLFMTPYPNLLCEVGTFVFACGRCVPLFAVSMWYRKIFGDPGFCCPERSLRSLPFLLREVFLRSSPAVFAPRDLTRSWPFLFRGDLCDPAGFLPFGRSLRFQEG